jgi:hypothetical protein
MSFSALSSFTRFSTGALLLAAASFQPLRAGEIVLSGVYQGKNLFVQNPAVGQDKTYCVDEVHVNDVKKMSAIKQSAFEIDLSDFEIDAPVTVKILYQDGCAPKYLFYVEHFVNGNWLAIKKFEAKNTGAGIYSLPVTHSQGINKYRIKAQNEEDHHMFYSRVVEFDPDAKPVTFFPKSVTSKITLSRATGYEVVDTKGNVLKKGSGTEISLAELKSGVYYLNIENRKEKFFKK